MSGYSLAIYGLNLVIVLNTLAFYWDLHHKSLHQILKMGDIIFGISKCDHTGAQLMNNFQIESFEPSFIICRLINKFLLNTLAQDEDIVWFIRKF